jgi:hypothetical protein
MQEEISRKFGEKIKEKNDNISTVHDSKSIQ